MHVVDFRSDKPLGRFVWLYIWGPINLFIVFFPLAILNLLQFPSLLILPFSRNLFRRYNRYIAFLIWGWWAWAAEHLIGLKIIRTGDSLPVHENAIVIANHQGMADIIVALCIAYSCKMVSHTTWLAKDVLKWVPGVGWGMAFLDCIFLKRDWAADAQRIKETFSKVVESGFPIWLISFPEGTRLTQKKLQASNARAAKQGLAASKYVLRPRTKGFIATMSGLRNSVDAVYDMTIGYVDRKPSLTAIIRGDIDAVHVHVDRFAIADLPAEEGLSSWLRERFELKDKRMSQFKKTGKLD